jgi:hypothetical protein
MSALPLEELVARLGAGVVRLPAGAPGDAAVRGVQVHDPLRPSSPHVGDLVLGVGVAPEAAETLALDLAARGAAGLLIKADGDELPTCAAPVVVVNPVVEWARLVELLQSALDTAQDEQSLFALCDAVAARVGAPVVLHDDRFRLLAYSSGQDLSDPVRRDTILGRQAPADALERLVAMGVVERLLAGEIVVLEEQDLGGAPRRCAIGLRTQAELLGSFWVQLGDRQVLDEAALRECAESAALAVVRRRQVRADSARREDELLHRLLAVGDGAAELALRLGVEVDSLSVLAGVALPAVDELQRSVLSERFAGLVRGFASAYRFTMCTAVVEGTLYALRTVRADEPEAQVGRAVGQLHEQLTRLGAGRVVIGLGDPAQLRDIARTRRDVDRLLVLLQASALPGDIARASDCREALELQTLRELLQQTGDPLSDGPLRRLVDYDSTHGNQLVPTLRAWFDSGGDVPMTGERLTVHANTVRYRMRRIQEICGLDLADPQQRFLAELQLRLRIPDAS